MCGRNRLGWLLALVVAGTGGVLLGQPAAGEKRVKVGAFELSGPHVHDNLTVFLIHGSDQLKGRKFVMLADALQQKKMIIYETQKVNDLAMENVGDVDVVILSGDILKGGQQDRIAQYDQIVPTKSGKLPLRVFCVERTASRWMKPLTEADRTFTSSPGQICNNDLRLANRRDGSQRTVWKDVAETQRRLGAKAGVDAKAKESDSSLALSLQVKEVQANIDKYVTRLTAAPDGQADVVGFVFAVNGKVLGSDVYGSPALFQKVWPRLLRASATEAFTERQKDKKFEATGAEVFRAFLEAAEKGKVAADDTAKGLRQTNNAKDRVLQFRTVDPKGEKKEPLRVNNLAY
jgi:hypothetical protein